MYQLDAEFKTRWLAALRSGRFIQTRRDLIAVEEETCIGHCCIAVGAAVKHNLPPDAIIPEWDYSDDDHTDIAAGFIGLGVADKKTLVEMNDRDLLDFNAIADWIEENL